MLLWWNKGSYFDHENRPRHSQLSPQPLRKTIEASSEETTRFPVDLKAHRSDVGAIDFAPKLGVISRRGFKMFRGMKILFARPGTSSGYVESAQIDVCADSAREMLILRRESWKDLLINRVLAVDGTLYVIASRRGFAATSKCRRK